MIDLNLTIDEETTKYKLPESWSEVTVGQWSEVIKANSNTGATVFERIVVLLGVLVNIEPEKAWGIDIADFDQIDKAFKFLSKPPGLKKVTSIKVGGDRYYVKQDYNKHTLGEIASLTMIEKDSGGDIEKAIPEMLCVFLRKKKENGKLESFKVEHMERAEIFRSVKVADANRLFLFFLNGKSKSATTTKLSSVKSKKTKKKTKGGSQT